MKKIVTVLIIVGIVLSLGFVISKNNSGDSNPAESNNTAAVEPNTVVIANFKYNPASITVKKGTTVTWRNTDTAKHDINFTDEAIEDGPLIDRETTYQHTFNDVGTFDYSCTPHPFMKASVTVTE